MKIAQNYLIIRTDENAPERTVCARDEKGVLLFRLQIRAAATGKPFYLDVARYRGKEISFSCGEAPFHFDGACDTLPAAPQRHRPTMHYTVPYGWLNDPNGLICIDGKYHIFCQHNPLGTAWGNMHWHHSVTEDFIRFEHCGDALFPDGAGTMFSGSAIRDTRNVSGLGKDTVLLYYTVADYGDENGRTQFSQGLAYSADGIHFTKYPENPVVPHITGENRDPKVVFVPEMDTYVMALYLDGDAYCLLKSDDLLHWEQFQTVHIPNDSECPDLYYLSDCQKWVLTGAADYYLVGHFNQNGFVREQEALRFYRELGGRYSYAAQSFSGTNGSVLRLSWENIRPDGGAPFCGQMSIPMQMSSVTLPDGTVRLRAALPDEMEKRLKPAENTDGAFIADIRFQQNFTVNIDGTELKIDVKHNTISHRGNQIPLTLSGNKSLRLLVDTMSIEILADGGLIFSSLPAFCESGTHTLRITQGDADIRIQKLYL